MDLRRSAWEPAPGVAERKDYDDYNDLLDSSEAIAIQKPAKTLPPVPKGVSRETHELVCATIEGSRAWRAEQDAEAERLKAKRLAELRATREAKPIREVGPEALLECAKKADPGVPVVVHVTNDSRKCKQVDAAMIELLARIQDRPSDSRVVGSAKPIFLKLHKEDAAGSMHEVDDDALPAILVYKANELISSSLRVTFNDADDLEDHLDDLGLFDAA